jgi:glycosyltransferase involved in cell wall biosynthesis
VIVVPTARMVIDLAEEPAAADRCEVAGKVKLVYLWRHRAVGEQLVELPAGRPPYVDVPHAVARRAREVALAELLRPALAPAVDVAPPTVSVIVCTLHRPDELAGCLTSVRELRSPPLETIVVNNDPADTAARSVAARAGARIVDMPTRGLSSARNAGIAAARGEIVAFVDDDCRVDANWLDDLQLDFLDPLVMAVVGYVGPAELTTEAQWLFEAQGGFERQFEDTVFDGARDGPWATAGLGDGNSLFRRAAFERLGGFAEDLGPGTPARSAQDAELFYRLMADGQRVRFNPARIVWHRHRRGIDQLAETLEGYTTGLAAHAARRLRWQRDIAALSLWRWWFRRYFPRLARDAARDRHAGRRRLLAAQVRGALLGPWRARGSLRRPAQAPAIAARSPGLPPRVSVLDELPAVSVVLASRDRRARLVQTLDALRAQRDHEMEVIVVLDGCTDDSAQAVAGLDAPWPLRVREQPPAGLAVSRNRGIADARHPLVLLLDDDIVPQAELVAEHARAHAHGQDAIVMGYHPMTAPDGSWWALALRAWWEDHFRCKTHPGWQPSFVDYCDGNSSLPRAVHERLGGFDARFTGGRRQDWELAIRAFGAGVGLRMHAPARADHHADPTFAAALRAASQEGTYDVVLARKHPRAVGRLPLAALARGPSPRRRLAALLAGPVDPGMWVALEHGLQQVGARRSWARVTRLAASLAYATGVHDALRDPAELDDLLAPVRSNRDVLEVPIDPGRGFARVPPGHLGRVALTFPTLSAGASLQATLPGTSWNAEQVLADAARLLATRDAPTGARDGVARRSVRIGSLR